MSVGIKSGRTGCTQRDDAIIDSVSLGFIAVESNDAELCSHGARGDAGHAHICAHQVVPAYQQGQPIFKFKVCSAVPGICASNAGLGSLQAAYLAAVVTAEQRTTLVGNASGW